MPVVTMAEPVTHAELRSYLADIRRRRGITQGELAQRLGTTQSAVSDLESGQTVEPGITTWSRWAAALDLELTVQVVEKVRQHFPIGT